ncbi:unnamed protein product, partial [marine sediment metagenome]
DDIIPDGSEDRRGWWGSEFLSDEIKTFGSKLWLLKRSKMSNDLLERIREYCEEALEWMIQVGITNEILIEVFKHSMETVEIVLTIVKPDKTVSYRYYYNWEAQLFTKG